MSLADWMSDNDYEWRQRLQLVNLVVETDFSADGVREAQSKYGSAARQLFLRGWSPEKFIKRFPALTLLVLVGHAALEYDQGRYWESFWDELGIARDQDFENQLRYNLFPLLDKFSLARFPRIEQGNAFKYVMSLALHAGIPVHCLGDLLRVINTHIGQGRPARGAALIEWLEEPGKEHRAATLDVPVRNFLMNGAEFAVDILDRIIEFVEAAAADPSLLDKSLDSSTTGLPGVLLDELVDQLREAPLEFTATRSGTRSSGQSAVTYNVEDDEIVVVLPTPAVDADLPWSVSFDGDVRSVRSARKWGGEALSARVAVPGPVREIVITHPGASSAALSLVVKDDPLLIFDKAGRWIPRRDGLKDCVWAVFPEHYRLVDGQTHSPIDVQDTGAPAGWRGWRSAFIELDDVTALQLSAANGSDVGSARAVRKDARPSFVLGNPVAGVLAVDGRTVYSTRPWVMLPPAHTDPGPDWNVRVRRLGATDWIVDEGWRAEGVETCVDPFDEVEDRQLGLFEIIVTGPLGADARCVDFLAEGLEASFDTWIRVPESGGLTSCTSHVVAETFSVSPSDPIVFGPRQLEAEVELRAGKISAKVVVNPPHIEMRTGETGAPAAWRMTPDVCDPDDFVQDRFVAVRAPGIDSVEFGYVSAHGDVLQRDPSPRHRQGDVFESRTQQFADTVRAYPAGRIVATLRTDDGLIEVTVLSAQPRQLASAVHLHEGQLKFSDVAPLDDLAVYVWSTTAPWRGAEVFPVIDGAATLPSTLIHAGELRCQLFVDDPWVLVEPPPTPGDTTFLVGQPGWREDGTPSQVMLSRYLGTQRSAPLEMGAIPEVWAAMARLQADGKTERFTGLVDLLADEPRKALECLGNSTIPAGDKMAMLIRSELVNHNYSAEETLNDLHSHPWFGCMVELADLPSLYRRRQEVSEERAQTLSYLRDRGGLPLIDLLKTGRSACAYDACFDANVFSMISVPVVQVEAKLQEIQQLPRAQLHPDSLRAAVYEAFCRRSEWLAAGWSTNFAQQVDFVLWPIERASRRAYEAIMHRRDRVQKIDEVENPWIRMPVQSLTLSILARLEAYGRIEGRYLNRGLLGDWAQMAKLCPTMVANDLLIAEALILYDRRGDLIGAMA